MATINGNGTTYRVTAIGIPDAFGVGDTLTTAKADFRQRVRSWHLSTNEMRCVVYRDGNFVEGCWVRY